MHIEAINPIFPCKDVVKSVTYYKEKLGFNGDFEWEEEGKITYAIIDLGGYSLHLTHTEKETSPALAYIFCSPIDTLFARAQEAGAIITAELAEFPWGMREFEATDPDGNRLIFGEGITGETGE